MKSSDLDRIIKLANQIAEENASVYGKQIKKSYIEKDFFRPDSFIRLAEGETDPSLEPPTPPSAPEPTPGSGTVTTEPPTAPTAPPPPPAPIKVTIPKLEWASMPDDSFEITKTFYDNIITAIANYPAEGRPGGRLVSVNLGILTEGQAPAGPSAPDLSAGFVSIGDDYNSEGIRTEEFRHPDGRTRKVTYNSDGTIAREAYFDKEGQKLDPKTMQPDESAKTTSLSSDIIPTLSFTIYTPGFPQRTSAITKDSWIGGTDNDNIQIADPKVAEHFAIIMLSITDGNWYLKDFAGEPVHNGIIISDETVALNKGDVIKIRNSIITITNVVNKTITAKKNKKFRIVVSTDISGESVDTEAPVTESTPPDTTPTDSTESEPAPQPAQPIEPPKPQIVVRKLTSDISDYAYFWNKYQGALSGSKWQIQIGDYRDIERTLYQLGIPKFKVDLTDLPNIKLEMCNQLNNLGKQIQEKLNVTPQPESMVQRVKKMRGNSGGWWSTILQKMIENQRG